MATGYTRIGNMLIPYEKPDQKKPTAKKVEAPKIEPVCPMPEPVPQKSFLESAVDAVKPKRRGRQKKNDEES